MKYAAYYYMLFISESVGQRTVNGGNLYCIDYTPRPEQSMLNYGL